MVTMIKVIIKFRDGTEKEYECNDYPNIGDTWITIFQQDDNKRFIFRSETIEKVEYWPT